VHHHISIGELPKPLIYDLDDFRRVAVVKMIGAVDQLASAVRRRARGDFLRVFVEKLGLGAADDGEQRTAISLAYGRQSFRSSLPYMFK
jgi:hypothetical protein